MKITAPPGSSPQKRFAVASAHRGAGRSRRPEAGALIHRFESCSSTNDIARRLAEEGAEQGTVVIAREQTAGRGTKARSWHSARDQGLYLSVILRPRNPELTLFPLAAGLAASAAIDKVCGVKTGLKWPNDVCAMGKKLGGILVESCSLGNLLNYAILGIGLNVRQKEEDFPEELRPKAISLAMVAKKRIRTRELTRSLLAEIGRVFRMIEEGKKAEVIRSFLAKTVHPAGQPLTVVTDTGPHTGVFVGLDERGGLLLEENGKPSVFYSAEITMPAAD